MPWPAFLEFCQQLVDDYNTRPHRTLPKIRDAATGNLRHQSPMEAWDAAIAAGWHPTAITPAESDDLFRPHKLCTVSRGEVRLFNNLYFDQALAAYHGEKVSVGYDIHDASRVWVRDAGRRLICIARFEANSRAYFPQAVIDQAKEKRAQGRIARAELRIEEAEAELRPAALLEHAPGEYLEEALPEPSEALVENVVALQGMRRPKFDTDPEKYRWLLEHEGEVSADDKRWLEYYTAGDEWFDIFGVGARRASDEEF
jgi:putative transposase